MAREIGWQETKIRFFADESTQNDQNRVSKSNRATDGEKFERSNAATAGPLILVMRPAGI